MINSAEISRDLNANEEHTHNIWNNYKCNSSRSKRDLNTLSSVPIKSKVQKHNSNPTKNEHEPRRKSLNNILTINPTRKENNGADGSSESVLSGSDAGRLDDDIVDNAWYYEEVSEEDKSIDSHCWGKRERGQLETETWWTENRVGKDSEDMEDWIHRRSWVWSIHGGRGRRKTSWEKWVQTTKVDWCDELFA